MSDRQDQQLDDMLDGHLRGCLDAGLGRSLETFRRSRRLSRRRWRLWTGSGMAAAAGIALSLVMFKPAPTPPPSAPPVVIAPAPTPVPMVQTTAWSGLTDAGTAMVDHHPMRQLRRSVVDQVEWYDASNGAMVRTTLPRRQIVLIGLQTH